MCLGSVHCLCHPSCLGLCRDLSVGTCSVAKGSATSQSSEPQTHYMPEVAHGCLWRLWERGTYMVPAAPASLAEDSDLLFLLVFQRLL